MTAPNTDMKVNFVIDVWKEGQQFEITLAEWLQLCVKLDPQPPFGTIELQLCLHYQGYFRLNPEHYIVELQ